MGQSTIAREQLRAFIERIERLEEEKKSIADDIRDVYAEAKGNGYDVKVMRQIVRLRKQEAHERQEEEAILELYKHALGMLSVAPDATAHSIQTIRNSDNSEELLRPAMRIFVEEKKVSFSLLERKLKLSAAKASKIVTRLEELGYISSVKAGGQRSILKENLDELEQCGLLGQ